MLSHAGNDVTPSVLRLSLTEKLVGTAGVRHSHILHMLGGSWKSFTSSEIYRRVQLENTSLMI